MELKLTLSGHLSPLMGTLNNMDIRNILWHDCGLTPIVFCNISKVSTSFSEFVKAKSIMDLLFLGISYVGIPKQNFLLRKVSPE